MKRTCSCCGKGIMWWSEDDGLWVCPYCHHIEEQEDDE
jgi:ribosomal protein S27AE